MKRPLTPTSDPLISDECMSVHQRVLSMLPHAHRRWPIAALVLVLMGVSFSSLAFLPQQKIPRNVWSKVPMSIQNRLHGAAQSSAESMPAMSREIFEKGTDVSSSPSFSSSSVSSSPEEASSSSVSERQVPSVSAVAPRDLIPHVPDPHRGVYLSAGSVSRAKFLIETVEKTGQANGNAVVIDVKGTTVYYKSLAPLATELGLVGNIYDLPAVVKDLKSRGIYVIARYVAVSDPSLAAKRPDTKVRHPKTNVVLAESFVDPSNPTVLEYNRQVICEVAQAGVDEINLDYIRFSTATFGALMVFSGEQKADRVEVFIKMSRDAIDTCNPKVKLGLSTFAILGWNYPANLATLGQDVIRFAPLVDVISPMAYPATFTSEGYYVPGKNPGSRMYYLVYRTLTGYQDLLKEESWKLRPWIQGYGVTAQNVRDQMKAVTDAGLCGFQVWNAGNNYGPVYEAMKSWVTPESCLQ